MIKLNKSQTIDMINRYYSIIENEDTSDEAREFINQFSLILSMTMMKEFDKDLISKLAVVFSLFTQD